MEAPPGPAALAAAPAPAPAPAPLRAPEVARLREEQEKHVKKRYSWFYYDASVAEIQRIHLGCSEQPSGGECLACGPYIRPSKSFGLALPGPHQREAVPAITLRIFTAMLDIVQYVCKQGLGLNVGNVLEARVGESWLNVKVVTSCRERIQHWRKVEDDYGALQERLGTLPDKLSYSIMVPFGPFAFMPGKLVHTNEVTVLLGDNWFAKCSAKQAVGLVEHRKGHVRKTIDDLKKVMTNFESRVEFTEDLQKMSDAAGDIVDIREEIKSDFEFKAKHRIAHKPHSKPKTSDIFGADFANDVKSKDLFADQELWARLEELEREEELLGELSSEPDTVTADGDDAVSPSEKGHVSRHTTPSCCHGDAAGSELLSGPVSSCLSCSVNSSHSYHSDEDDDGDDDDESVLDALGAGDSSVPTIYFSHTVEPKRVRINTGKNTTLKFSEKKEEAKRKRRNSCGGGHPAPELPTIRTPADIYRVFVDLVNGEYVPRKSILKSRSREDSVCSDTSESSAADFDERRGLLRSVSCEEATCSDASESILEEEQEQHQEAPSPVSGVPEAFSGTVIEKELSSPCLTPNPAAAHPVLPTIPERREVPSEASEVTKRVSKFKAARLQQKN